MYSCMGFCACLFPSSSNRACSVQSLFFTCPMNHSVRDQGMHRDLKGLYVRAVLTGIRWLPVTACNGRSFLHHLTRCCTLILWEQAFTCAACARWQRRGPGEQGTSWRSSRGSSSSSNSSWRGRMQTCSKLAAVCVLWISPLQTLRVKGSVATAVECKTLGPGWAKGSRLWARVAEGKAVRCRVAGL